jgi:hypothetical protein
MLILDSDERSFAAVASIEKKKDPSDLFFGAYFFPTLSLFCNQGPMVANSVRP